MKKSFFPLSVRASSHTFTSRYFIFSLSMGDYKGIYPSASLFNHSCIPNAHAVPMNSLRLFPRQPCASVDLAGGVGFADEPPLGVTLEQPLREIGLGRLLTVMVAPLHEELITVGEEITIAYTDTDQPRQATRRLLAQEYFFDCMCTRCKAEEEAAENPKRRKAKGKRTKGGEQR